MATLAQRVLGAATLDRGTYEEVEADASATGQAVGVVVLVSVAAALLGVATPVLAGKVVDAITTGSARTVLLLAAVIAAVAVAETGASLVTRWGAKTDR